MRAAALSVLLVGCGFSQRLGGDVTGDATPPGDAPPGDRDDDGVLDLDDNCPDDANPAQRDHDMDGVGDPCDPCPHLMANGDGDGDGVGDACDPRPTVAGDTWTLFGGFYGADDTMGWTTAGTWTYDGTTARQNNTSGLDHLTLPGTFARASVVAGVTVDSLAGGSSAVGVSTGLTGTVGSPSISHSCVLIAFSSGQLYAETREGSDNSMMLDWPEPHQAVTLRLETRLVTQFICRGVRTGTTEVSIPTTATTAGKVALVANDAASRFDYVFVVETGP